MKGGLFRLRRRVDEEAEREGERERERERDRVEASEGALGRREMSE